MQNEVRLAAERAAEAVYQAAKQAIQAAVDDVLTATAAALASPGAAPATFERVTRTEAARQLGVTAQRIIRAEKRGDVTVEKVDGRALVSLAEVRDALGV